MKYKCKVIVFLVCFGAGVAVLSAQVLSTSSKQFLDVEQRSKRFITVENFDTNLWEILVTPGQPNGKGSTKLVKGGPSEITFFSDTPTENKNTLGVNFLFVYPGNNYVELLPPKDFLVRRNDGILDENNQPSFREVRGITLNGFVDEISVWVLSRGHYYKLECWVEDYKGFTHVLQMGHVGYIGWKSLNTKIPKYIPQIVETFPQSRPLILKKFVLRGKSRTPAGIDTIVFFDGLRILTDIDNPYFEGIEMDFDESDKNNKQKAIKVYKTKE